MKTWLAKFKISTALDRSAARSARPVSEEVRGFEKSMHLLDGRLRSAGRDESVPPTLHTSIMRAVRLSRNRQQQSTREFIFRRLPAPALVLLLVIGIWWSLRPGKEAGPLTSPSPMQPLIAVAAAWDEGRALTQTAPGAALAPLSGEMELVARDFHNAVTFLAASLP